MIPKRRSLDLRAWFAMLFLTALGLAVVLSLVSRLLGLPKPTDASTVYDLAVNWGLFFLGLVLVRYLLRGLGLEPKGLGGGRE